MTFYVQEFVYSLICIKGVTKLSTRVAETAIVGRSERDVTVSTANPAAQTYTAEEVLAFWNVV